MGTGILIVDDAAFMRMMLTDILVENGYKVVGKPRMVKRRSDSIRN